uniref:Uncharacterized protein n=1 Tax=Anguilla anguilla TaxID=7936 RepID=A0A0E9W849_ANGAN
MTISVTLSHKIHMFYSKLVFPSCHTHGFHFF